MDQNRIRKLLSSEYKDFSEDIIVESPFAETTRDGRGVREVSLALTRSKLIVATDVFGRCREFMCLKNVDPCIECFELISVYPLEFVNLSVFRRRRRKTLKARLVNGRVTYYEIGGIYNRKNHWKLWCTQVEILATQKETGSSLSETTAGSSSSSTTLYFLSSDHESQEKPRLWAHYLGGGDGPPTWPRKDIYLGPSYNELGNGLYAPIPIRFAGASFNDLKIEYELRPVSLSPVVLKSNHSWPVKKSTSTQKDEIKKETGLCDVLFMHRYAENRQTSASDTSYSLRNDNYEKIHYGCGDHENFNGKSRNFSGNLGKIDNDPGKSLAPKISRFGFGIRENCSSGLYLQPHEGDPDHLVKIRPAYKLMDPYKLIESGVLIWENSGKCGRSDGSVRTTKYTDFSTNYSEIYSKHQDFEYRGGKFQENLSKRKSQFNWENSSKYLENSFRDKYRNFSTKEFVKNSVESFPGNSKENTRKHLRRHALSTSPHFFFGLGPWSINPGDKFSIQVRRCSSLVTLRKQPAEEEMRLPVSKKQLSTSVSMTSLEPETCTSSTSTRGRIVIFWTPDYWYRPRQATVVYKELRSHLKQLQSFHSQKNEKIGKKFKKIGKNSQINQKYFQDNENQVNFENFNEKSAKKSAFFSRKIEAPRMCSKSSCILNKIFSVDFRRKKKEVNRSEGERAIEQLRQLLKLNFRVSIWDIDSSTLAQQLTLIDRDLFLRIPASEVEIIIYQKSSRNAPNVGAWIAFSHRIASLTASEILSIRKIDMRARMLARFINSVNKCYLMGNFNSAKSILAGLQSPPIFRLRGTWNYVKIHHATRYETFTRLCRIFKNCRTTVFLSSWAKVEGMGLPFIGHVLARILAVDNHKSVDETPRKLWTMKDFDCGCTYLYQAMEEEKKGNNEKKYGNGKEAGKIEKNEENLKINDKKINLRSTPHTITENTRNVKKITRNSKNREINDKNCENGQNLLRKMISSTFGKVFSMNSGKACFCGEPSVFWAARRLMLARRAVDRWQMRVLTGRIIREHEEKRRKVDDKRKRAQEVCRWLSECQKMAREFDFPAHSVAWEFLLKARYKEDKENFFVSLKLEPPLG